MRYLRDKIAGGLAPTTVIHHVTFLGGLFRFRDQAQFGEFEPGGARRPSPIAAAIRRRRLRFLQPEELETLLGAVPGDERGRLEARPVPVRGDDGPAPGRATRVEVEGHRLGGSARCAWLTTIRAGATTASIRAKSHMVRSTPMADRLAGQASNTISRRSVWQADDDLVFCHPQTGRPYDASKLRKRFDVCAQACRELRRIAFHELRHTFGTQMAAAGAPLRAIQEWMGHANASTTRSTPTTPRTRPTVRPSRSKRSTQTPVRQRAKSCVKWPKRVFSRQRSRFSLASDDLEFRLCFAPVMERKTIDANGDFIDIQEFETELPQACRGQESDRHPDPRRAALCSSADRRRREWMSRLERG